MPAPINLAGRRFQRLTVLELAFVRAGKRYWRCACECGQETVVSGSNLGKCIFSCGCLKRELAKAQTHAKTHGMKKTPEYAAWNSMLQRCFNSKCRQFHNYGGRGITVCDAWRKFERFYADMGRKPESNFELDRINNDGNYEPGNCRWTTRSENIKNSRPRNRDHLQRFAPGLMPFVARGVDDVFAHLAVAA